MSSPHRIAIIGIGAIADLIAHAIEELPNAQVIAGCCRTRDKGEKFAAKHKCNWHPDADSMLAKEKPEIAVICTPSGAHLEPVLACAKHKVHVLCEKPIEVTAARVNQMIDAAHRAGIVLGGLFPQRFNPVIASIHDAAVQGRFGNLAAISAAVPWWRDDNYYGGGRWQGTFALDGGGALMNQSIHYIDILQWLAAATMPDLAPTENPVEEIVAYTAKRSHDPSTLEVEDTAVAILRLRNGALAQILGTTSMYPGSLRRLHIGGRDGTVELREDELITFEFRAELPIDKQTRDRFHKPTTHEGGARNPMAISHLNHKLNIAEFLDALEKGREPALSGHEAGKAVAIIEACYESAQSGKPVRL